MPSGFPPPRLSDVTGHLKFSEVARASGVKRSALDPKDGKYTTKTSVRAARARFGAKNKTRFQFSRD